MKHLLIFLEFLWSYDDEGKWIGIRNTWRISGDLSQQGEKRDG